MCEFYVADALDVQGGALKGRRFDTVLDSACLQVRTNFQTTILHTAYNDREVHDQSKERL